jgi:hypothetical protein
LQLCDVVAAKSSGSGSPPIHIIQAAADSAAAADDGSDRSTDNHVHAVSPSSSSSSSSLLDSVWQRIVRFNQNATSTSISISSSSSIISSSTASFMFYQRPPVSAASVSLQLPYDRFVVFEKESAAVAADANDGDDDDGDGNDGSAGVADSTALKANADEQSNQKSSRYINCNDSSSSSSTNPKHTDILFRLAFRGDRFVFALDSLDFKRSNRFVIFSIIIIVVIVITTTPMYPHTYHFQLMHAASAPSAALWPSTPRVSSPHRIHLQRCNIHRHSSLHFCNIICM